MADQGAEGFLSPFLRRQRFRQALPHISGRVLDIGCGVGQLANFVTPSSYYGTDLDPEIVALAREQHPYHHFSTMWPASGEKFDTISVLAVIEHVKSPAVFLQQLSGYLRDQNSRIVCTTPHPSMDWAHDLGAKVGLFSAHANEEHEELLCAMKLMKAAKDAELLVAHYHRFLMGANQLALFVRKADAAVPKRVSHEHERAA